jgi:hypothetical protein
MVGETDAVLMRLVYAPRFWIGVAAGAGLALLLAPRAAARVDVTSRWAGADWTRAQS